jgi:phytoene synthase
MQPQQIGLMALLLPWAMNLPTAVAPDHAPGQRGGMTSLPLDCQLAATLVPPDLRPAFLALFALDDRLAGIVRITREPLIGQMRLTWWYDALNRLDTAPAPAEPLLQEIAEQLLPIGITGADLAAMTDGWEALIVAEPLDEGALASHADLRGAKLFVLAGRLLGRDSALLGPAGRGWAYADLAVHLSSSSAMQRAGELASEQFRQAFSQRWPTGLRAVGVLSLLARMDAAPGSPIGKALAVARFRLFGR